MLVYLLNSLWQVPVIFAAGWIAARMARRSGPELEHRVWVVALLLQVLLPACRFRPGGILRMGDRPATGDSQQADAQSEQSSLCFHRSNSSLWFLIVV